MIPSNLSLISEDFIFPVNKEISYAAPIIPYLEKRILPRATYDITPPNFPRSAFMECDPPSVSLHFYYRDAVWLQINSIEIVTLEHDVSNKNMKLRVCSKF